MGLADIKTTEWLLINWGRWAHQNKGVSLNYPSTQSFERMRARRSDEKTSPGAMIDDDEAMIVDGAVAKLCAARPKEGDALAKFYLYNPTYRKLGEMLEVHHAIAASRVDNGRAWVEGRLCEHFSLS